MTRAAVLTAIDPRGVATVTLNRPEINNAYDGNLLEGLAEAIAAVASDPDVRVVVLRANGRHFQAGADLTWLRDIAMRDAATNLAASRLTAHAMRDLHELSKPTVALVQGACIGGGSGIVASCDIVIAEHDAVFAISEARWGVVASIIFPQLISAIGLRQVRRYALSCERFTATRAREIGLVHEVCAPGQSLDDLAAPVLDGLLSAAPQALAVSKRGLLRGAGELAGVEEFERLINEHAAKRQSSEAAEGFASFADKRPARWYPGAV
ncbi:MAG: enoyl-CoA hydratase-related protein [Gammaproteobacteria bacterium]